MNKIKFSIIICTYNMADCIKNAIESVLMQKFKNYEIIVYNDCSKDNTIEVIKEYKNPNIKLINGKKNIGLGASRNQAVIKAKGEYILYLDADDTLFDNMTLTKINEVIDKEKVDVAYFGVKYIGGSNATYVPNKENSTKEARILCDMHFAVSSKCWRREFLNKNNITFIENMYYEDMVYSIKSTILAEKTTYGEFPIYNYVRNHDGSITSTPNLKKCVDMYKMLAYITELYDITPEKYKPYLMSFIEQETNSVPFKIKEILKAQKENRNTPVFPKRQYTFKDKIEINNQ